MDIRIAIFHGLGDCINATTLIRPILTRYPNTRITWITSKQYKGVVKHNPYISAINVIDDIPAACDRHIGELKNKYGSGLILPAPYLNRPSRDRTLLGHFKDLADRFRWNKPIEPLLYVTQKEIIIAKKFISNIGRFILLETKFSSSQSKWNQNDTIKVLRLLAARNYTVLLAHRQDEMLQEFNKHCKVYCLDFDYRLMPVFYNHSAGFIGVSSGISCVVHTHQCKLNKPHLEFVEGEHWCTRHYRKDRKTICFNLGELERLVRLNFL